MRRDACIHNIFIVGSSIVLTSERIRGDIYFCDPRLTLWNTTKNFTWHLKDTPRFLCFVLFCFFKLCPQAVPVRSELLLGRLAEDYCSED